MPNFNGSTSTGFCQRPAKPSPIDLILSQPSRIGTMPIDEGFFVDTFQLRNHAHVSS
ncbi:hypothetical protein Poly21_56240 [Allorhodopirellula heiligendammensis]|uniref:Uncharacterized protein n=1 Tax=Allorhodopirellula heiligendammensis TaxID=2714739 RepID=A0A5C6B484_9BACT|nr:hypothetical protein Poly21_56240 [Allorhodopirellula heiligendammensis]